jgi:hypothetical protein
MGMRACKRIAVNTGVKTAQLPTTHSHTRVRVPRERQTPLEGASIAAFWRSRSPRPP